MIFDEACPVDTPLFIHPCCLVSMGFLLTFLHPPCTLLAPWVLVRARKVHGGCTQGARRWGEIYGKPMGNSWGNRANPEGSSWRQAIAPVFCNRFGVAGDFYFGDYSMCR